MAPTTHKLRTPDPPDAAAARRAAIRLVLWYAAASAVWILLSDELLGLLRLPPAVTVALSQVKGLLFVVVTSAVLYFVANDALTSIRTANTRYHQLFTNAAEGLTFYRIKRDRSGKPVDMVVEDVNDSRLRMSQVSRDQVLGKSVSVTRDIEPQIRELVDMVWAAVLADTSRGLELHDETRDAYLLAAAYPVDEDLWALSLVDVTDERLAEKALRDQEEAIRSAYVDVLDAVTGGKLILLTESELHGQLGEPTGPPNTIRRPEELANARAFVRGEVHRRFPASHAGRNLVHPVGEALNNALSHAGSGTYQVFTKPDGTVQVAVSDRGPGIDFRGLPKAAAVQGFSTTATLGAGFTIMLAMSDRVLLVTRPGLTIIVLECQEGA